MPVKFVPGIGSAPAPCALAAELQMAAAKSAAAKTFSILFFPLLPAKSTAVSLAFDGPAPKADVMSTIDGKPVSVFARMMVAAAMAILVGAALPARAAPEIGKAAPDLVVTELDGQTFDLAKLRGKVVLVNYWATWCAPCRKDMPLLDAFYRSHRGQSLDMIGISIDRDRDLGKVRKVMSSLAYPVAVLKGVTVNGFGPPAGVPITWIIDPRGTVHDMMIDVRDELLKSLVVPLLSH